MNQRMQLVDQNPMMILFKLTNLIDNKYIMNTEINMQSEYTKVNKPKWEWKSITGTLKVEAGFIINLKSNVTLVHPLQQNIPLKSKLIIDTQKSLQYSQEIGWNWHKSWNLPTITIVLEVKLNNKIRKEQNDEILLAPENLTVFILDQCQIYAVKQNCEESNFVEVSLKGITKQKLVQSKAIFTGLKFQTTSYNNQGNKFQLIVILHNQYKILAAATSSPIFVDSRKCAREGQLKKIETFIQPFHFNNLQKNYVKRENKKRGESQVRIQNDYDGFYNYLTAPNIRHKIKHPLLFVFKFSNCVKMYYNPYICKENNGNNIQKLGDIIKKLQRILIMNSSKTLTFVLKVNKICNDSKNKKIQEILENLKSEEFDIVFQDDKIPQEFVLINDLDQLKQAYKKVYSQLLQIKCQEKHEDAPQLNKKLKLEKENSGEQETWQPRQLPTPQFNMFEVLNQNFQNVRPNLQYLQMQNILLKQLLFCYISNNQNEFMKKKQSQSQK